MPEPASARSKPVSEVRKEAFSCDLIFHSRCPFWVVPTPPSPDYPAWPSVLAKYSLQPFSTFEPSPTVDRYQALQAMGLQVGFLDMYHLNQRHK